MEGERSTATAAPVLGGLRRYVETGVYAGAVVFAVEAVDRIVTLWPSFVSPVEPLLFALYLVPSVLLGLLAGVVLGLALTATHALYRGVAGLLRGLLPKLAPWIAGAVTVLGVGLLLRWGAHLAYDSVEFPLFRFVKKVDKKLVSIDFVVANFAFVLLAACIAIVGALLVVALLLGARRVWRWPALVGALLALGGTIVFYGLDSRFLYGRYEWTIHIPAAIGALAFAFVAVGLVRSAVERDTSARGPVARGAVVLIVLAVAASAFDVAHVGTNENLKTLLWRRGVVARRAYQIATTVVDRDRDGFSPLFRGGDLDDRNPNVNPLATEIPGNGVDENCFGGDGTTVRTEERPAALVVQPAAPAGGAGRNLIFIAIDTLRANRMSAYGYGRETSPRLAEWGARGRFFERAYSQGSNTGQTFAAMQRSATRGAVYESERPTMFARLRDAGYRTAQINARRDDDWLTGGMWAEYRRIILDGVETITHTEGKRLWDGDTVTDEAITYFSALDPSVRHATWVHYLDPHAPRRKMAPFDFGDSASDKYDSEVAFSDREVGRLLDWLEQNGHLERSIVVLMADHGEGFDDHGMDLHGNRPYDDQIHVPLVIWAPGVAPGRVAVPVSTNDIAPTVLSWLALPTIPGAEGQDLLAGEVRPRPIFCETPRNGVDVTFFAYAVTDGDWRFIYDVFGNTVELYDLSRDPLELRNLADSEPAKLAEMRALMARWLDATESVVPYTDADDGDE